MPTPELTTIAPAAGRSRAVVLMLHGGRDRSDDPVLRRHASWWRMALLQRRLATHANSAGVAVELLRYAVRGWNGTPGREPAPVRDGRWALERIEERYGPVPVVLVGHSMGGRAVCALAGEAGVRGVVALAPWLPEGEPVLAPPGQRLVMAHGLMDRWTSPRGSRRWAERARSAGVRIARFELPMVGHFMLGSGREWNALVRRASLGLLGLEPLPAPVEQAYTVTGGAGADGLALPIATLDQPS